MKWFSGAAALVLIFNGAVPASAQTRGIPQPKQYAALLEKARRGELREDHPERMVPEPMRAPGGAPSATNSEVFRAAYRVTAKTTFATAPVESFASVDALFAPLPSDAQMTTKFPSLKNDTAPRVALEKRNVKVPAWIYWVVPEGDRDFHIILGSTPQLTSATVFMNAEVSGLPPANPTKSPFPQRRKDIRAIRNTHHNVNGLFDPPVPVTVTGSLLWDREHRAPHNVGTGILKPKKAWEIHPIKELKVR